MCRGESVHSRAGGDRKGRRTDGIRRGRESRRNPKIARILYYSKDIESFGTGLKRIADACEATGVRYEFKKMKSGFVVCFYRTDENTMRGESFVKSEKTKSTKGNVYVRNN